MTKANLFIYIIILIAGAYFGGENNTQFTIDQIQYEAYEFLDQYSNSEQTQPEEITIPQKKTNNTRIANFNIQIFGDKKITNTENVEYYIETINQFDILFIQEIRDKDGSSFIELCTKLPGYKCTNSSRAGRSFIKEQYGIIYKNDIQLVDLQDYQTKDPDDIFEREPVAVTFKLDSEEITIYNIHTKPLDVQAELQELERIIHANSNIEEDNIIILGDLNADCRYYNPGKETEFDSWIWLIEDEEDTTVGATHCAYDRIIINRNLEDNIIQTGIKVTPQKTISDHHLVWTELQL